MSVVGFVRQEGIWAEPILMVAMLLESRYAERVQARLKTQERGILHRARSAYARGVLPWLQLTALCGALAAEVLAIHVLAVGAGSPFTRTFLEYGTYLLLTVLVMGLVDISAGQV